MSRKGIRPHSWKSGPDIVDNKLYIECQRRRAQAKFRGEQWLITESEYIELWRKDDLYQRKGRSVNDLCMTLVDPDLPWTLDNIEIITRSVHYRRTNQGKFRKRHKHELV
jgi:hypothetical protein